MTLYPNPHDMCEVVLRTLAYIALVGALWSGYLSIKNFVIPEIQDFLYNRKSRNHGKRKERSGK